MIYNVSATVSELCQQLIKNKEWINMINSKSDYLRYLKQDKLALGKNYKSPKLVHDEIWKFFRS